MTVNKNNAVAAKAEEAAPAAPQSIAIELVTAKRYIVMGDSTVYEAGIVYDMDEEAAKTYLRKVDDEGMPVFVRERPKKVQVRKPDRDLDAESRHEHRERIRVTRAAAPVSVAKENTPARARIELGDDTDEELNAHLQKATTGVSV